jgi:predicted dehydrogenase
VKGEQVVGIAVVGAGYWGPNLISNFDSQKNCTVFWVVEKDERRRKEIRANFGERIPVVGSLDEALNDDRVDGVVIATPTSTHFDLGMAALAGGKHVLMEKPLAASVAQAEQLCEQAETQQLTLMVGHVFLFNQAVRQIKQYLSEGLIGRPLHFDMARRNLGPIRRDVNAAWDLMPHDIAMLRFWLDADPVSVFARGSYWRHSNLHDAVSATLIYPGGIQADVRASWMAARKNRDVEIVGDRMMIFFNDNEVARPIRIYDQGVLGLADRPEGVTSSMAEFLESTTDGDIREPKVTTGQPLKAECEHFKDCIETGQPPLTAGRDGLAVVRVLEAIDQSLAQKREVEIEWT